MTPYDAAMAGLVVAGMIWGGLKGITWQVASIASLVFGYTAAHTLSGPLASQFPGEPAVARSLAMVVIYAAVSGGIFVVAWTIRATLKKLKFEAFDRHLGMVLGGLEGALLGLVGTVFVVGLAPKTRDPIFQSPSGRVVAQVMDAVGPVLPGEVRDAIAPFWARHATETPSTLAETVEKPALKLGSRDRAGRFDGSRREAVEPAGSARPVDDLKADLGRAAGQLLETGIQKGEAPNLDDLVRKGKARLGRAAGELIQREVERLGASDGETPPH